MIPLHISTIYVTLHPNNSHCPIGQMSYRYCELYFPSKTTVWWFAGSTDLSPTYLHQEDGQWFHRVLKKACEPLGPNVYADYKKWADNYFYLPNRYTSRDENEHSIVNIYNIL